MEDWRAVAKSGRLAGSVPHRRPVGVAWAVALVFVAAAPSVRAESPQGPAVSGALADGAGAGGAVEPRAVALLQAMSQRLAAANTLSFQAVTHYESPSRLGPPLVYTTHSAVTVQRPNRFRVVTRGDGPATEIYDDGKTLLAYAPAEDLVAVAEAPPSIDAALRMLYESAAVYLPFTDVIVADPWADIAEGIEVAFVIGQSQVVGDTTTDIVAVAAGRSFQQIWIGADDHLPRRIRAIYAHDPSLLRHDLELSGWKLDGAVPDGAFTSSSAAGAKRIPFARPDPKPPADAKKIEPGAQKAP